MWATIAAGTLVLILVGLVFVVAPATDRASFCRSCHEMVPYNEAWTAGPHRTTECVECHVAPGRVARLLHKWVAMNEVRVHLLGDPKFPGRLTPVPNDRCRRCHPRVKVPASRTSRFSHAQHAKSAACWECHTDTGHRVPLSALASAGVLADNAKPTPAAVVASEGASPRPGHVKVTCSKCHDQSSMACGTCHKPPHPDRGACDLCHRPGKAFAFNHPAARDCERCHKPPARHFGPDCASCHSPSIPFARTVFRHPSTGSPHGAQSFACSKCHPSGPPAVSCTCHGGGRPSGD